MCQISRFHSKKAANSRPIACWPVAGTMVGYIKSTFKTVRKPIDNGSARRKSSKHDLVPVLMRVSRIVKQKYRSPLAEMLRGCWWRCRCQTCDRVFFDSAHCILGFGIRYIVFKTPSLIPMGKSQKTSSLPSFDRLLFFDSSLHFLVSVRLTRNLTYGLVSIGIKVRLFLMS